MFKRFKQRKAQANMSEYMFVFFLIITMISAMTVYFRRAVQARIFSAREYVLKDITNRVKNGSPDLGSDSISPVKILIYREYEPYYMNTASRVFRDQFSEDNLIGDQPGKTGIYKKTTDDFISVQTNSVTAPPKSAD